MNKAKFNQNSGKDLPEWAIGPFVKHKKNPLLQPSKAGWDRGVVWNKGRTSSFQKLLDRWISPQCYCKFSLRYPSRKIFDLELLK